MVSPEAPCPCHSGKSYGSCCRDFHSGALSPPSALLLMRSRYAAYSLHLFDYIMATTHPSNSSFQLPKEQWKRNIEQFCIESEFPALEIIDYSEEGSRASVTFRAHLIQNQRNTAIYEKRAFLKVSGKWLYVDGEILS